MSFISSIPNILSFLRLLISPFLFFIIQTNIDIGFILFLILGLTDGLDGTIARITKSETTIGKILDPLADKVLVISTSLAFYRTKYGISHVFFKLLILREILILFGALWLLYIKVVPNPSILGKITTFFNLIILILLFLENILKTYFRFTNIFYEVGIFLIVSSFLEYLVNTIKIINQKYHKVLK